MTYETQDLSQTVSLALIERKDASGLSWNEAKVVGIEVARRIDLPAIERAAIHAVLDRLQEAVEALPSADWDVTHDHSKTAGPVWRGSVLAEIEKARP